MRMLRSRTTIPVPRPLFMLPWGNYRYMITTRVPGCELEDRWDKASDGEKDDYIHELQSFLRQLRHLRSPFGSKICSASGLGIWDHRIRTWVLSGPFDNEVDFNQATILQVPLPQPPPSYFGHDIPHRVTFTHSDFARRNIMVKDGRVTAIVDWETAGWYPAHWEYLRSQLADRKAPWSPHIHRMIPPFESEWHIEITRIVPWLLSFF